MARTAETCSDVSEIEGINKNFVPIDGHHLVKERNKMQTPKIKFSKHRFF
jgi:hypothetical protein